MSGVLKAADSTVIQVKHDDIVVCLFLRPSRNEDESVKGRSVFVRGVPCYWPQEGVRSIFKSCGKIASCVHVKKPGKPELCGYKVTFKREESAERAMNMPFAKVHQCKFTDPHGDDLPELYKEYIAPRPDAKTVIADVDRVLTEFLKKKEEEDELEKELAEPNEDGWKMVTKQSKNRIKFTGRNSRKRNSRLKKQNAEKELLKFYKFQEYEEKKQLARVEQLQAEKNIRQEMLHTRKFRPY